VRKPAADFEIKPGMTVRVGDRLILDAGRLERESNRSLAYRWKLADGKWTDWSPTANFAHQVLEQPKGSKLTVELQVKDLRWGSTDSKKKAIRVLKPGEPDKQANAQRGGGR
jgi:hypothetical protein